MIINKEAVIIDLDEVMFALLLIINNLLLDPFGIVMEKDDWAIPMLHENPKTKKVADELLALIHTEEVFLNLKPLPGAVPGINLISQHKRIFFTTSRNASRREVTKKYLLKTKVQFEDLFCGECKAWVANHVNAVAAVDDFLHELEKIHHSSNGNKIKKIVNDKLWNQLQPSDPWSKIFTRAYGWVKESPGQITIPELIL